MKNLVLIFLFLGIQLAFAQNIAYIESNTILDKMPEYETAVAEIENQINAWETELENKFESIETMYTDYVQTEAMLSDEVRKQKQDAIFEAERIANEFKEGKFGQEGELYTMQDNKLKPLFDKINQAAEAVAKEKGYDYVFDKSVDSNWIYTNSTHDLTEDVVKDLQL